jgi:hypothetical protein
MGENGERRSRRAKDKIDRGIANLIDRTSFLSPPWLQRC